MQQIWTDDELRTHWVLSDAELGLLKGTSGRRRLTLCVYLKYFQLHAGFPGKQDAVPHQVMEFLAAQVGCGIDARVIAIPDRTARSARVRSAHFLKSSASTRMRAPISWSGWFSRPCRWPQVRRPWMQPSLSGSCLTG